ncbi:MAG: hypothetical protein PHD76_10090 [Methylacidiphilales bacterium]|nr:hypothetical protein [Candidatus Methylacidiphilales bacterium]
MKSSRALLFFGTAAVLTLLCGCNHKEEIQVYRVSKAPPEAAAAQTPETAPSPEMPPAAPMPPQAQASGAGAADSQKPQIKWKVPDGWKSVPASSMRYASFSVAGQNGETGDISIVTLPGEAGGDLENVNRWRGQAGLEPVGEPELKSLIVPVKAKGGEILTVDMPGAKSRILAAWTRHEGSAWFFKLNGPDHLVAGEKARFLKFLQSVEFGP